MDNNNMLSMPGYRYGEYLLVLNPHEDFRSKIINIRKEFGVNHQVPALGGKPHITLVKFIVWDMMEEKITNRLKVIAMGTPPFKAALKDYGSFPSHSIHINVATKIPIYNLVKELRTVKRIMKSPEYEPYFVTEPHLPVSRKLNPAQYEKAWQEYSHRSFTGSFIADGMLLLKRRPEEKAYQIVQRLDFMNLPVSTRQGELFV